MPTVTRPSAHSAGGSNASTRSIRTTTSGRGASRCTRPPTRSLRRAATRSPAGCTVVGEFHYPHHQPGGSPYPDRNAMAKACVAAAADAGIEIVMLMCAYARAGAGQPPAERQRRFCDPTVAEYLSRVEELAAECRVGLAPHSVRALPRDWLEEIAG